MVFIVFLAVYQGMVMADPNYFKNDFWNAPGYMGTNPPASLLKARIQKVSKIKIGIPAHDAVTMGLVPPEQATKNISLQI